MENGNDPDEVGSAIAFRDFGTVLVLLAEGYCESTSCCDASGC